MLPSITNLVTSIPLTDTDKKIGNSFNGMVYYLTDKFIPEVSKYAHRYTTQWWRESLSSAGVTDADIIEAIREAGKSQNVAYPIYHLFKVGIWPEDTVREDILEHTPNVGWVIYDMAMDDAWPEDTLRKDVLRQTEDDVAVIIENIAIYIGWPEDVLRSDILSSPGNREKAIYYLHKEGKWDDDTYEEDIKAVSS